MDFTNQKSVSEAILNFIYELPNDYKNYSEHVLRLISKYFGQDILAFIPSGLSYLDLSRQQSDYFTADYMALNVSKQALRTYNRYYYNKDIFRHSNLPHELRHKSVISIEDIMPYEDFRKTEYYMFLQSSNISHQVIINLIYKDILLGAIGVYHRNEDGAFTREQLTVFETISKFIVQHYIQAVNFSDSNLIINMIREESFQDLIIGIAILNNTHTVLEANSAAQHYAKSMLESGKSDFLSRTSQVENTKFLELQQIINLVWSSLYQHKLIDYNTDDNSFQFHLSTFASPNRKLSKIETFYSVFITQGAQQFTINQQLLGELTDREREVVNLISKGSSNAEIAKELHISVHTVKTHVLNVFKKQGVNSRTELLSKLSSSPF